MDKETARPVCARCGRVFRRMSRPLASPGCSGWRRAGRSGPATVAVVNTYGASRASSTPPGGDVESACGAWVFNELPAPHL